MNVLDLLPIFKKSTPIDAKSLSFAYSVNIPGPARDCELKIVVLCLKLVWRLIRQEPHGESLLEITQKLPKNLIENSKYGPQSVQKASKNSHSRSLNPGIAKMFIFHTNDASFESALGAPWEPMSNPFGLMFAMKSGSKTPSALQWKLASDSDTPLTLFCVRFGCFWRSFSD